MLLNWVLFAWIAFISNCSVGVSVGYAQNKIVTISGLGNDTVDCLFNALMPCRSLDFVLTSRSLNNTLVIIEDGVYTLSKRIYIQNIINLNITGKDEDKKAVIKCERRNGLGSSTGLAFQKCVNISMANLELRFCGMKFNSTSRVNGSVVYSQTALLMGNSQHVTWSGVHILDSAGIGSVFYDVTGNVDFNNVLFENNTGKVELISKTLSSRRILFQSGGGMNIEFTPLSSTSSSNYTLRWCKFAHNSDDDLRDDVMSDSSGQSYFSLGRGGGISFISRGSTQNNHLSLKNCILNGNRALWGAGVFAEFNDKSGNNMVKMTNTSFFDNVAVMAGGAVRIAVNSNNELGKNTVELQDCYFAQNRAKMGGAFSEYQTVKRKSRILVIKNTGFQDNVASVASDIHVQQLHAALINVSITFDRERIAYLGQSSSQGSLYCSSGSLSLREGVWVNGASNTGFVLDFCDIVLHGTASFKGNTGVNGGAMTLYGQSRVRFTTGSLLTLHSNTARNMGGAIYVETPIPLLKRFSSSQLNVHKCFFVFGDTDDEFKPADDFNATIDFLGNTAPPRGGDDIWATTLSWCRGRDEPIFNNSALKWKIMKSNGRAFATGRSIITSPGLIVVKKEQWDAHPGIAAHVQLILRDENWNVVNGTIQIKIHALKKNAVSSKSDVYFIANSRNSIHLMGFPGSLYNVTLRTLDRYSVSTVIESRELKVCPPGFYWKNRVCLCQSIDKGVTNCNSETRSVYIIPSRWGDTRNSKEFAKKVCPVHYCNACSDTGIGCLFKQADQCAQGRDSKSTLCSKCKGNLSVQLGSEKCDNCTSNIGILWLALFTVGLTVLVFAILLINLDAHSTYLNGFLYSYQIIPFLLSDEQYTDFIISFVIALTNVSGTGKLQKGICIWVGMNNMQKLLLNYLTPSYLIVCTMVFGALSSVWRRCPFNRKTTFRALVFISVIAYADFTKISFKILQPVEVAGKYYAYYAAYMPYFGNEHAPYAVTASVVFLFVVIGFPLALIFPSCIVRYPMFVRLMGIFDTFQQPFRRESYVHIFPAFYFINRFVLQMLKMSIHSGPVQNVAFSIACVVILVIFILCKPYTDWKTNFFDGLQLTNLVFMAIIFTAVGVAYENEVRVGLSKVICVLAYIPLLCIFYRITAKVWSKVSQYRLLRKRSEFT